MRLKEEVIQEVCNRHNMLISSVMTRSNLTEVVRVRRAIAIDGTMTQREPQQFRYNGETHG